MLSTELFRAHPVLGDFRVTVLDVLVILLASATLAGTANPLLAAVLGFLVYGVAARGT